MVFHCFILANVFAVDGLVSQGAEIYIKNDNTPVLADWNPTRAYGPKASPEMQAQVVWDEGLVPLLSKVGY